MDCPSECSACSAVCGDWICDWDRGETLIDTLIARDDPNSQPVARRREEFLLRGRRDGAKAAAAWVRDNAPTTGLPAREAVLIEFGRELLDDHTVSAVAYARALETFGQGNLVNFVDVMARSAEQITLLTVFDQRNR